MNYILQPNKTYNYSQIKVYSFVKENEQNIDSATVLSFENEWDKFSHFSDKEIEAIGSEYFDIIDFNYFGSEACALDVGCGSGRWSAFVAKRLHRVEAIDPNLSVLQAAKVHANSSNIRFTHASVSNLPFRDGSFDFVFSLGVLHHVPDTFAAIKDSIKMLKPNGVLLLYLYYSLDNRGFTYRLLFKLVNLLRSAISKMNNRTKGLLCDLIACLIYFPLASFAGIMKKLPFPSARVIGKKMPLSYYSSKSFKVMRNDALDRFGTPLEKRFSRSEIQQMLVSLNMTDIIFSENEPYWHVKATKS